MLVVSDTSPLLNLATIGRLPLLEKQCGHVVIPPCVLDELRLDSDLPGSEELRHAKERGLLVVEPDPGNADLRRSLCLTLDAGEAAAIAMAIAKQADLILLDDLDARRTAASLGLCVTGVVGVLLRAKREGDIDNLHQELANLRQAAGFRLGERLLAAVLEAAGETAP